MNACEKWFSAHQISNAIYAIFQRQPATIDVPMAKTDAWLSHTFV